MSRSAISVLLSLFLSAVSIAAQDVVFTQGHPDEVEITAEELADKIIEYAETFLGTPYRYGANGPRRFDCTGYTRYVFKHFGYDNLSRSSRDQAQDGREVDISDFHNLQKGDILLHGHTHVPKCVEHETYTYLNPGSVGIPKEDSWHGYMILEDGAFLWKDMDGNVMMDRSK